MIQFINKNTVPYLHLLDIRTKLSESPLVKEMAARATLSAEMHSERFFKDFCIKVAESDVRYLSLARIWGDLDGRWPTLAEDFASRVEVIDETFLSDVRNSHKAFSEEFIKAGDYLADKTFCGTILIRPKGISLSYRLSFDCCGEPEEDSVLLMLDETGMILTYVSPAVLFVCREVKDKATKHLLYVMPPLDIMMGATQMKFLVRDYLLYCHFASVKAELVTRCGSHEEAQLVGDSDSMVNCFPLDIWRLTGDGPFVFPEAGDDENDVDND